MNYRIVEVMPRQAFGIAGTHIQPIRTQDPITALNFHLDVTSVAVPHLTHLLSAFPKIELVDGSDVIMSISGEQMDGMHFFDTGKLANHMVYCSAAGVHDAEASILFGRWRGDELLALDPKKFNNLQLRVIYNSVLHGAANTGTGIEVHAECFDEKIPSPIGFLQNREYERHVPTIAGAVHEVELPVDLILRKIIVQAFEPGATSAVNMGIVRLDEDNDKRILLDLAHKRYQEFNRKWYGECWQKGMYVSVQGAGNPLFCAPTDASWQSWTNASALTGQMAGACVGGRCALITNTNTELVYCRIYGDAPYQMFAFPFGKADDIADWYDTTKVKDLLLRISGGTAPTGTGATRTILQQLRKY